MALTLDKKKQFKKTPLRKKTKPGEDVKVPKVKADGRFTRWLPQKEKLFVDYYVQTNNGALSYLQAGYKAKSKEVASACASSLLKRPRVAAALEAIWAKIHKKTEITAERVLKEYASLAFSDVRNLFKPDGTLKEINDLDNTTAAAVASVEVAEFGKGIGVLKKVKQWDKVNALNSLAKYLKLITDKTEVEVKGSVAHQHIHAHAHIRIDELSLTTRKLILQEIRDKKLLLENKVENNPIGLGKGETEIPEKETETTA